MTKHANIAYTVNKAIRNLITTKKHQYLFIIKI